MPIALYSFSTLIISVFAGLFLFVRVRKDYNLISKSFFRHYILAFLALSLTNLPIILINLGFQISYNALLFLYGVSFFAVFFSYMLFYRGTLLLFTKDSFFTTAFPLIFSPAFLIISSTFLFAYKIETFLIYTIWTWGFLLPLSGFLGSLFLYFFLKGAPYDSIKKRHFSTIFFSLGWFLLLIVDLLLWITSINYSHEFWILKIASTKEWFLIRDLAYLIILSGAMFYIKYLNRPADHKEKL